MADVTENVELKMLLKLVQDSLAEQRATRRDLSTVIQLATKNLEYTRRIERRLGEGDQRMTQLGQRIDELKDDFEAILKLEVGGSLVNFETRMDERFDALKDSLAISAKP